MTSNNIDTNAVLQYVSQTFTYWGIDYIEPKILSKAKANNKQCVKYMRQLLFDLCMLHIFNYEHTIQELGVSLETQISEKQQIILAHLSECDCQYLIHSNQSVGLNFDSSRSLLMCCGWIMAVSNYFHKIQTKKLNKILQTGRLLAKSSFLKEIQSYKLKGNSEQPSNTKINELGKKNKSCKLNKIAQIAKSIQIHGYRVSCLQKKKQKLNLMMKKMSSKFQQKFPQKLQEQFIIIIKYQIENMRNRQYFWIWLDQNLVKAEQKELKQNQYYQQLQATSLRKENYSSQIIIDRNYLLKFVTQCSLYQQRLSILTEKMNQLLEELPQKQNKKNIKGMKKQEKQIECQVKQQICNKLYQLNNKDKQIRPSFIGIQLGNYMGITDEIQVQKGLKEEKQIMTNNQLLNCKEQLRHQIKIFMNDLTTIKFI